MSEKQEHLHSLTYDNNLLTVHGVKQVVEITETTAQLKLVTTTLHIKGTGLNVVKLDKDQGVVQLETKSIVSFVYRQGAGFKGLFR